MTKEQKDNLGGGGLNPNQSYLTHSSLPFLKFNDSHRLGILFLWNELFFVHLKSALVWHGMTDMRGRNGLKKAAIAPIPFKCFWGLKSFQIQHDFIATKYSMSPPPYPTPRKEPNPGYATADNVKYDSG